MTSVGLIDVENIGNTDRQTNVSQWQCRHGMLTIGVFVNITMYSIGDTGVKNQI